MRNLTTTLSKQAARTVASRAIRKTAKGVVPTNSIFYKMGVSALIAGVGHLLTKGITKPVDLPTLAEDGFDSPPDEIELSEKEMADILHQRTLSQKSK